MKKDWELDEENRLFWKLHDLLHDVEDIDIVSIKELCEHFDLSPGDFVSAWEELTDQSHSLIRQLEDENEFIGVEL